MQMFKKFFEGWYFKHQNDTQTVAIIPGISASGAFVQIITDDESYNVNFPKEKFIKDKQAQIENNLFSKNEIKLDIETENLVVKGQIFYHNLTPLKSDIMGPFRFLPMPCRHGIISMHHKIDGQIRINGKPFEFIDGTGYIEKDSGISFPKNYAWIQSNDFDEKCSIVAAIADVPICGLHFKGLICAIYYQENQHIIATYNGGKILRFSEHEIIICNKDLRLEISIPLHRHAHNLAAPINGNMVKVIKEPPSCQANFKFFKHGKLIFDMTSSKASFEFVQN